MRESGVEAGAMFAARGSRPHGNLANSWLPDMARGFPGDRRAEGLLSSAALYSQLPICEAALAPISARAPGMARTSRYARAVVSPIAYGCGLLPDACGHHRAPDPQFCGDEISSAIQQRLAAQAAGDITGFADRGPGRLVIVQVAEVLGVVEQAVGQVAGVERWCRSATAAGRRPGRRRTGIRTGRRAGGRPPRMHHTVGTGSVTPTARPRPAAAP